MVAIMSLVVDTVIVCIADLTLSLASLISIQLTSSKTHRLTLENSVMKQSQYVADAASATMSVNTETKAISCFEIKQQLLHKRPKIRGERGPNLINGARVRAAPVTNYLPPIQASPLRTVFVDLLHRASLRLTHHHHLSSLSTACHWANRSDLIYSVSPTSGSSTISSSSTARIMILTPHLLLCGISYLLCIRTRQKARH